jgi:hypothetical protein
MLGIARWTQAVVLSREDLEDWEDLFHQLGVDHTSIEDGQPFPAPPIPQGTAMTEARRQDRGVLVGRMSGRAPRFRTPLEQELTI